MPVDPLATILARSVQERTGRPTFGAAPTRVLQRKVGFEFEDADWRPWKIIGKGNNQQVDAVKRKESVHRGPGYNLEADDSLGPTQPTAEFVTQPFEETDAGVDAAEQAFISMATLAGHMDQELGRPGPGQVPLPAPWGPHEHAKYVTGDHLGLSGGQVPHDRVLFSGGSPGLAVKMQITSGISLRALPMAMSYLGYGQAGEAAYQAADRDPGRRALYLAGRDEVNVVGASPEIASDALTRLRTALNANPTALAALNNAADLTGLLSAMMLTLKMLQLPMEKQIKYRLPLMPRTSFAAMFKTLPKNQRELLHTEHAMLTQALVDASNARVLLSPMQGVQGDAGLTPASPLIRTSTSPVAFPGHVPTPKADLAFAPVTIAAWVKGVTRGKDYLIPSKMEAFLKSAGTSKAVRSNVLKNLDLLESFGSIGKMDEQGNTKLAVFENRAIAPVNLPHTIPLDDALRIAWNQLLFFKALRESPNAPGGYPDLDVGQRPGDNQD